MKILQIIPYFCFGGAETMCENLSYAQQALGHQVTVVSLYNQKTPISERMEQAGVDIRYLDKKLGMDPRMVPQLVKLMREIKPDAVHTHLDVVKYAALAAKLAGIGSCVHTVHNVAEKEAAGLARKINKVYFRLGWAVPVALSPLVRQTIAETYGLEKVPMVYNGIDLSRCLEKEDYSCAQTVTLLHIGRFNAQKNHKRLLHAFHALVQHCPQAKLQLIGDGELRPETEELARQLGLTENVAFLGSQSNVYPFLRDADIFVLPSDYEGMPMTVIEAMGTGLPIVATRVGGLEDMLKHEVSGLLVPCDEDAVTQACLRLIEDLALRQRLGTAAKEESTRFSAAYMAQCYCDLYASET